ncbi:hypothetical protein, partial [Burkholderia sp. Cy-647]|uniref:hypothetical protein n=1 Tax=Burkholderia sp. Cy-647 TaxID=2608328 RepID=UPI001964F64C
MKNANDNSTNRQISKSLQPPRKQPASGIGRFSRAILYVELVNRVSFRGVFASTRRPCLASTRAPGAGASGQQHLRQAPLQRGEGVGAG